MKNTLALGTIVKCYLGTVKCFVAILIPHLMRSLHLGRRKETRHLQVLPPLPQLCKNETVDWEGYIICILVKRDMDHLHLFPVCTARNRQYPICRVLGRLVLVHLGWLPLPCHKNVLQGEYPIIRVVNQSSFLVKLSKNNYYLYIRKVYFTFQVSF